MKACTVLTAAALAGAFFGPAVARAYEGQWHAGASLGYVAAFSGGAQHGLGGGLDLGYGVRDWLDVAGALDTSYHPSSKAVVPSGVAGVRFAYDVLQVVPYAGVLAGVAGELGPQSKRVRFALAVPFGADYQLSRRFSIGLAGRFQLLLGNGAATPLLGAALRVSYAWGY